MTKNINKQNTLKFSDCIDYYEVCNRAEGKSLKTYEWYTANLKLFQRFLKARKLPDSVNVLSTKLLREYIIYLQKKGKDINQSDGSKKKIRSLSTSTIHAHVRTLRAFASWLVREGILEENIGQAVKPPKVTRKIVSTLSDDEIRAIFKTFDHTSPIDIRNETVVAMLLDTGLRIGELADLMMEDLHIKEGYIKVLGKGNKERIVPIGSNAQKALQKYIFRCRSRHTRLETGRVFLSVHGEAITNNSMKLMFARLAKASGVSRLHAHLFRHTFATRYLVNGGDIFSLQQILGHSSLEMVRHYVTLASSHLTLQHRKFSPLDRMKWRT